MSTLKRPVVALDVDDVLNADGLPVEHVLHIPAVDQPKSPFLLGGGERDMTLTIHIDPAHGQWIRQLQRVADVVWATTWEHAANLHLAPLLGIDELPVATAVAVDPPRFGYVKDRDSVGWKAAVLSARYPGRPLVWVDDGAGQYTHEQWDPPQKHPWNDWRNPWPSPDDSPFLSRFSDPEDVAAADAARAPALVVTPRRGVGLTAQERDQVLAFVTDPFGYRAPLPVWD